MCYFLLQVEGISNVEFQLRVSLFDLAYHQFFGRQWAGQYSELAGLGGQSKPKLRLSQVKFITLWLPLLPNFEDVEIKDSSITTVIYLSIFFFLFSFLYIKWQGNSLIFCVFKASMNLAIILQCLIKVLLISITHMQNILKVAC
jgi:hypothetical protein